MNDRTMPWYVRWVVGVGAWVTAVVLIALGGVFVFELLSLDSPVAISVFGAAVLVSGLWLLRQADNGVFARQLGIAAAVAGAIMVCGGLAAETESIWVGFFAATAVTAVIIAVTDEKTVQFLTSAAAVCFYVIAVQRDAPVFASDFVALATPAGLALLLYPPRRDLVPLAIVLLLTFPLASMLVLDTGLFIGGTSQSGMYGKILHIVLFLALVYLHWRQSAAGKANWQVLGFAVAAVVICLLLPAGGSAAMLILMLAFVIGWKPLAILGGLFQAQFIVRYYYTLEMNLLHKSLLLMAVGSVLLALWWLLHRHESGEVRQ